MGEVEAEGVDGSEAEAEAARELWYYAATL